MTKSFDQVKHAIESNGDALFHCVVRVPRHQVKKNSRDIHRNRRTGRLFPGKSPELVRAESILTEAFQVAALRDPKFRQIQDPAWCVFLFYFPADDFVVKHGARKGKLSGRLPDLSNLLELPADCLQRAGVIENDRIICSFDLSRRLPGKEFTLEVFIFEYNFDHRANLSVVP